MANLAQVLDDNSSNGKKIAEIFDKHVGKSMKNSSGQLKTGYELLSDIAGVWDTLDGNTQKYIATTIAGKQNCPFKVNCWEILKLYKLQHEDEICLGVKV